MLVGIGPDTPLGRIVSIRAEKDKDRLKYFTKEQHRIRNEWKSRQMKQIHEMDRDAVLEQIKQAFISMAGGGKN